MQRLNRCAFGEAAKWRGQSRWNLIDLGHNPDSGLGEMVLANGETGQHLYGSYHLKRGLRFDRMIFHVAGYETNSQRWIWSMSVAGRVKLAREGSRIRNIKMNIHSSSVDGCISARKVRGLKSRRWYLERGYVR